MPKYNLNPVDVHWENGTSFLLLHQLHYSQFNRKIRKKVLWYETLILIVEKTEIEKDTPIKHLCMGEKDEKSNI